MNMSMYLKIAIIGSVVLVLAGLLSFKTTLGQAGSLDPDAAYRNELVNYLLSHNMTFYDSQLKVNEHMTINNSDTYELEAVVNGHKNDCQVGTFDRMAENSNLTKTEISNKYGNC